MRRSYLLGSSLLAAFAASLCCILPIIAAVTGVAALGAAARFEHYRPYLLGLTGFLFVVGAVRAYRDSRRACEPGSLCEVKPVGRWNILALSVLGVLVVALAAFPLYSGRIAEAVSPRHAPKVTAQSATTAFLVPDMDCPACAAGLRASFEKLPGVNHAAVDYNTRRVTITYDPTRQQPQAFAKIVAGAGFHVKPLI